MKLYPPTHEPVHIALLNGNTTLITKDGTDVDKQFLREALDRGCFTEPFNIELIKDEDADEESDSARKDAIKDAINDMLNGTNEGDFNADGKPDLRKLSGRAGFKVSKAEMEAAFSELV